MWASLDFSDAQVSTEWTMTDEQRAQLRAVSSKERDRLIREIYASGASIREIAEEVGLSHGGVHKIIKRTEETS